ncbi:MAG: IclR family transcriptional regulator [Actinomycetes bacterium]
MTTASKDASGDARPASQTLDRGLRALELVAGSDVALTVAEVATRLELHRSITYRMLRTLEDHRLVQRDADNRYRAGAGLAVLARMVAPTLQAAAVPELSDLANDVRMTAFLVVRHDHEAVTVAVVEPRQSTVHVVYRPGTRHPVDRGAPGLALLAGAPPVEGERAAVTEARRTGYVSTHAEVLPGMRAVASPVVDARGTCHGAVSVVFVGDVDLEQLGARVRAAARAVASSL